MDECLLIDFVILFQTIPMWSLDGSVDIMSGGYLEHYCNPISCWIVTRSILRVIESNAREGGEREIKKSWSKRCHLMILERSSSLEMF